MEAFVYYLAMHGAEKNNRNGQCFLTAEEAFNYLVENKMEMILKAMERGAEERIKKYLKDDSLSIRVLIYSMKYGLVE